MKSTPYILGIKFRCSSKIDGIDKIRTSTNDIFRNRNRSWIEAARNAIINEISKTLGEQGLSVDIRHIMLVSDMMTHQGVVNSIGRHGISGKNQVFSLVLHLKQSKHLLNASIRGS